jgi:uncharacterized membrane protein YbhN (UPF0104 family)
VILGIGISVAFGYLAFRSISWQDVYEAVKKVQPGLLGASFLFLAVSVALSARRWQLLIGHEEVHWLPTLAALVVGLMVNNVLRGDCPRRLPRYPNRGQQGVSRGNRGG